MDYCKSKIVRDGDMYTIFGKGGKWSIAGVCSAYDSQVLPGVFEVGSYIVSVDFYHVAGDGNRGYPGVMYNTKDLDNFDYIFFRYYYLVINNNE